MKLPEWVDVVKTSTTKELAPYDPDWYYTRCASLARHIYIRSPVGVSTVCKIYGGVKLFAGLTLLVVVYIGTQECLTF